MALNYRDVDYEGLAQEMARYAKDEHRFLGAAVVKLAEVIDLHTNELFLRTGTYVTCLSRRPDMVNKGPEDKGTNYLAMADAKADKRLRQELGLDTEDSFARRGEIEVGGDSVERLADATWIITAFSGAPTPEEDQIVTKWGLRRFHQLAATKAYGITGSY